MTLNGFVELGSSHVARAVAEKIKTSGLKLQAGGQDIRIKRAITDLDRRRNYALHAALELVTADNKSNGKTIETKDRTVLVNNVVAYSQKQRYEPSGAFEGDFQHLQLPQWFWWGRRLFNSSF